MRARTIDVNERLPLLQSLPLSILLLAPVSRVVITERIGHLVAGSCSLPPVA